MCKKNEGKETVDNETRQGRTKKKEKERVILIHVPKERATLEEWGLGTKTSPNETDATNILFRPLFVCPSVLSLDQKLLRLSAGGQMKAWRQM